MTTDKPKKKNPAAQALGRLGGSVNSPKQIAAKQASAKFAGRPRRICTECGKPVFGGHKVRSQDLYCHSRTWTWQKQTEKRALKAAEKQKKAG
jgi:hypothetical protein